jgi:aryl-alcohol dehydrogenase-like predicted oxidoreductase
MAAATAMVRRPLGTTGLTVSPLGLASLSVRTGGPRGLGLSANDIERAYHEYGINTFFVTWHMKSLADGVRRLVRGGHRDDLVLISMASLPRPWLVHRAWEKNARALAADVIDVFLLGWVQSRWYVKGGTWSAMAGLRERNQVRAIGFSCHNRVLGATLAAELPADVLMIRYNAAHRGAEREVFPALAERRPGIIAYTATRWGMLLKPLPRLGYPAGMTAAECYRFALSHPAVDTVLCGARTPEELREDAWGAAAGPLDPERSVEVRRFGDAVHTAARGGQQWMFRQG